MMYVYNANGTITLFHGRETLTLTVDEAFEFLKKLDNPWTTEEVVGSYFEKS